MEKAFLTTPSVFVFFCLNRSSVETVIFNCGVLKKAASEPWGFPRQRLQKLLLAPRRVSPCLTFVTDDPGGIRLFSINPPKEDVRRLKLKKFSRSWGWRPRETEERLSLQVFSQKGLPFSEKAAFPSSLLGCMVLTEPAGSDVTPNKTNT